MVYLNRFYLVTSRRDLVSKFDSYTNVSELDFISYIDLNFSELKNKSFVALGLGFFYLLVGKRGRYILPSTSLKRGLKKKLICSLRLNRKQIFNFLEKLLFLNFDNVSNLKEFYSKNSLSKNKTFSFTIKDIYNFTELEENSFKFRNLNNLRIFFTFSNNNKKKNFELLKSLGFKF